MFHSDTGYRTVPPSAKGCDDHGPEFKHLPVCPAFKEIGEHRGSFDLGLIPIGAYNPRQYVILYNNVATMADKTIGS